MSKAVSDQSKRAPLVVTEMTYCTCGEWASEHPDGYFECSQCGVRSEDEVEYVYRWRRAANSAASDESDHRTEDR